MQNNNLNLEDWELYTYCHKKLIIFWGVTTPCEIGGLIVFLLTSFRVGDMPFWVYTPK